MRRLSLLALAAVALLAGCGGGGDPGAAGTAGKTLTKAEYEQRFKAIVTRFENSPEPKGDEAQVIETGLKRAAAMAEEIDELEPPAEIARAHDEYVAGVRAVGRSEHLQRVIDAIERGERRKAEALLDRPPVSQEMIERMARARAEFAEKGYDLGDVTELGVGG